MKGFIRPTSLFVVFALIYAQMLVVVHATEHPFHEQRQQDEHHHHHEHHDHGEYLYFDDHHGHDLHDSHGDQCDLIMAVEQHDAFGELETPLTSTGWTPDQRPHALPQTVLPVQPGNWYARAPPRFL